ncbi:protein phosphatase CheZ [Pseudorhodoferax aquiterrae]|uniref:Protein phosphatase CheZ n=1 Tax=Pseudorhodoferax aquiterrae TaxID=747304 RepID=A0ABQ3G5N4_9BURK|nr:protein phosphatase CheZ [Pseudorhodoferax aquiterrae]GHC89667.1 protein phosphatase CheZ [Pseudorhodoferax aquiterrae]
MQTSESLPQPASPAPAASDDATQDVHHKLGLLTRQLHDSLAELGYAEKLRGSVDELPDAQSRLTYIARLTGEAAEKVLSRVEQAKTQHDFIAAETRRVGELLVKDPVAAVARGVVYNFLGDVDKASREIDQHLTEIMMAQDFHDLTGQVIARVVNLAATIEEQLVALLIQTAPPTAKPVTAQAPLQGPVVNGEGRDDVVTDQSQVDDLLASLGF